jgi:hypothetical protein
VTAPPATLPPATVPPTTAPPTTQPPPATPKVAATSSNDEYVLPIVECWFRDPKTRKYNTVWGYASGRNRTIPIGPDNKFNKPAQNAGQPTTFSSGIQHNVFVVTHSGSATWTLTGLTATSPGSAKSCDTNPVPVASGSGGWAGLATIAVVTVLLGAILAWRVRRGARRA